MARRCRYNDVSKNVVCRNLMEIYGERRRSRKEGNSRRPRGWPAELLTWTHLPVNVNCKMSLSTFHSIAQVCQQIGVSPRTVRYYEELGLLPGVRRRNGGRRVYGPDEIERLRFIQRLKQMGLSLQEIGDLNAVYAIRGSTQAMLEKLRELLCQHLNDVEAKIHDLQTLQSEMKNYLGRVDHRIEDLQGRKEEKKYASSRS
jgi:DNA-binding transcriptional MerR regulator